MANTILHQHPTVEAYDILQVKKPVDGWQDFSTIRTPDEARQAVALVVSCLFDGRPMVFRILQGGPPWAVRYIHQDDPNGLDAAPHVPTLSHRRRTMAKTRTWVCSRCGAHRANPAWWTLATCPNKTMPCYGQPMHLGDTVGKWKRTARRQAEADAAPHSQYVVLCACGYRSTVLSFEDAEACRRTHQRVSAPWHDPHTVKAIDPRLAAATVTPEQENAGRIWQLEAALEILADFLEEAHQLNLDEHHGDDDLAESPCSYCAAIATARTLLKGDA
jgi:hypothetical protein